MGDGPDKKPEVYKPSQSDLRDVLASQNEAARYKAASQGYNWFSQDDQWAADQNKALKDLASAEERQAQVNAMGGHGYYKQRELKGTGDELASKRAANPFKLDFGTQYEGTISGYKVKPDAAFTAAENAKNAEIEAQFQKLFDERVAAQKAEEDAKQAAFQQGQDKAKSAAAIGSGAAEKEEVKPDYSKFKALDAIGVKPSGGGYAPKEKPDSFINTNALTADSNSILGMGGQKPFMKSIIQNQSNKLTA